MAQNSITGALPPLAAAALLAIVSALGCSSSKPTARTDIRAHTRVIGGVPHAEPVARAERFCAECHGKALSGGANAEPSCYTCHGRTWPEGPFEDVQAPSDHSVINKEFRHHPGLFQPAAACVACHGVSLEGDLTSGLANPGCELCHTRLWEERAAP